MAGRHGVFAAPHPATMLTLSHPPPVAIALVCRVVMAAQGQPMSLSFVPSKRTVLYGSETMCVMLQLQQAAAAAAAEACGGGSGSGQHSAPSSVHWRPGMPSHRIDLNEGVGEVAQITLAATPPSKAQAPAVTASGVPSTALSGGCAGEAMHSNGACDAFTQMDGWCPFAAQQAGEECSGSGGGPATGAAAPQQLAPAGSCAPGYVRLRMSYCQARQEIPASQIRERFMPLAGNPHVRFIVQPPRALGWRWPWSTKRLDAVAQVGSPSPGAGRHLRSPAQALSPHPTHT